MSPKDHRKLSLIAAEEVFLIRNGDPLTYQNIPVLILFPFLKNTDWDAQKVAEYYRCLTTAFTQEMLLAKQNNLLLMEIQNHVRLTKQQMKEVNELQIPGVFAVEKKIEIAK